MRASQKVAIAAAAAMLLTGCTSQPALDAADSDATVPVVEASSTPVADPVQNRTAVEGFRAWLEASRIPDADVACAGLTPELVTRMLDEMSARGFEVSSCEEMITATAELYRAFEQDAEIDIDVRSETETDATLFVTYDASGDCGLVVMRREGADWIITEQSEEICE